jgi:hypothetical protein
VTHQLGRRHALDNRQVDELRGLKKQRATDPGELLRKKA